MDLLLSFDLTEIALLAGLAACAVLVVALWRETGATGVQPAA